MEAKQEGGQRVGREGIRGRGGRGHKGKSIGMEEQAARGQWVGGVGCRVEQVLGRQRVGAKAQVQGAGMGAGTSIEVQVTRGRAAGCTWWEAGMVGTDAEK